MRDLWMRYKKRELTEKDHERIFWLLFVPYVAGSVLGGVSVDGELGDPSNTMLYWAVAIFFLPWLVIILLIQAHTPPLFPSIGRRIALFVLAVILAVVSAAGAFGYMNIVNAFTGSPTAVMVSGPVISMRRYSGGWAGPRRVITIRFENRDVELSVKLEEYNQIKVGDIYSRQMKLGGLGYYYQWGFAFWK